MGLDKLAGGAIDDVEFWGWIWERRGWKKLVYNDWQAVACVVGKGVKV